MACIHRLQHIQRLGATHLTYDDPVGPHSERILHQVTDGNLTPPFPYLAVDSLGELCVPIATEVRGVL